MKRLVLFTFIAVLLMSCGNDRSSPVGPHVNTGPYKGDGTYHNEIVYNVNTNNHYESTRTFPLYFEFTGLDLTVHAAHGNGKTVQVQLYDWNDNLILHNKVNVNGDFLQQYLMDLPSRPAYVIFDISGFSGNMTITMKSYAR